MSEFSAVPGGRGAHEVRTSLSRASSWSARWTRAASSPGAGPKRRVSTSARRRCEACGDGGEEHVGGVGVGRGDAEEGGEAGAGGGAQGGGGAVAGVDLAVEAGAALGGFGGADGHGQPFGDEGAQSAGAPDGCEHGGDGELEGAPEPAGGDQVDEAALVAGCRPRRSAAEPSRARGGTRPDGGGSRGVAGPGRRCRAWRDGRCRGGRGSRAGRCRRRRFSIRTRSTVGRLPLG